MVKWQSIDKKSLPELERHYWKFEPYCHLNIVDMWAWRVTENHWFKIGDTVVYRLNDYNDSSLYLTVLGKESAQEAIRQVCEEYNAVKLTFKCMPQVTVDAIENWPAIASISEDLDNHDYIFDIKTLIDLDSPQLKPKQKQLRRFNKRHPSMWVKLLNHKNSTDRQIIYGIFKKWAKQTNSDNWHKEFLALKRILNLKRNNMVCLGFFDGRKAVGYTVNEPENNEYYQAFSGKGDRCYRDLGLYMEHETAKYIYRQHGSKFINLQPDQGLEGLRQFKTSLGPLHHLKKYIVVINSAKALA